MNNVQRITNGITVVNLAASHNIPHDAAAVEPRTYVHSAKHSTFIMPDGEVLQFMPVGTIGHLTTSSTRVQAELDAVIKKGGSTIRSLTDHVTPGTLTMPNTAAIAAEALGSAKAVAIDAARAALVAVQNGSNQLGTTTNIVLAGAVNTRSAIAAAAADSISK